MKSFDIGRITKLDQRYNYSTVEQRKEDKQKQHEQQQRQDQQQQQDRHNHPLSSQQPRDGVSPSLLHFYEDSDETSGNIKLDR